MSDIISCPDCNSQDVQEINKNMTVTQKSGCGRDLAGCLFFPLLFFWKKEKVENKTDTYYACRACGREFRKS